MKRCFDADEDTGVRGYILCVPIFQTETGKSEPFNAFSYDIRID